MSDSPKKKTAEEQRQHELKKNVVLTEHKEPLGDLQTRLGTSFESGLTTAQVKTLQDKWGANMLTPPKETPMCIMFVKELTGFFSLLLWLGAVLCFVAYYLKNEADNLYLGTVLALVVLITGIFSFLQNKKSSDLMKSFANMLPPKVLVLRDGVKVNEDAKLLVPGDIVEVNAGDLVPADLRVLECSDNLQVDNSSLTGESEPQKRKNVCTNDDPLETQNLCFFGTQIPEGSMTAVVISTGDHTVMGRIAALAMQTKNEQVRAGCWCWCWCWSTCASVLCSSVFWVCFFFLPKLLNIINNDKSSTKTQVQVQQQVQNANTKTRAPLTQLAPFLSTSLSLHFTLTLPHTTHHSRLQSTRKSSTSSTSSVPSPFSSEFPS